MDKLKKSKEAAPVSSQVLALALVRKMVAYEAAIDAKSVQTPAEQRHVAFLRAVRNGSFFSK